MPQIVAYSASGTDPKSVHPSPIFPGPDVTHSVFVVKIVKQWNLR
jgi:hypothetical protein